MKCYHCKTPLPQSDPGDTVRCDVCGKRTRIPEKQSFFALVTAFYQDHKVAVWFVAGLLAIMYFSVDENPAEAVVLTLSLYLFSAIRKWHLGRLRKSIPVNYPDAKDSRVVSWILHNSLWIHCLKVLGISLLLTVVMLIIAGKQEKGSAVDKLLFCGTMGTVLFAMFNTPRAIYHGLLAWFNRRKLEKDELCEKHRQELY